MKGFVKWSSIGCGGLVALLIFLAVLGAIVGPSKPSVPTNSSAQAPAATATPLPGIGERVVSTNFAFTITDGAKGNELGGFTKKQAQGIFIVLTTRIENVSKQSQIINAWDFKIRDAEGRRYDISSEGSTALLGTEPEPFWMNATVQPGLSKTVRLVFDVNPDTKGLGLEVQGGKLIALR